MLLTCLMQRRRDEMVEMYKGFCKDYPVISIEDPFDQDDSAHVTKFTAEGVCQVCAVQHKCVTWVGIVLRVCCWREVK